MLKSLSYRIDQYVKQAGLLQVPPKLLQEVQEWAVGVYCGRLNSIVGKQLSVTNKRKSRAKQLEKMVEDGGNISFLREKLLNQEYEDILPVGAQTARDIEIRYFSSGETDDVADQEGFYDWYGEKPKALNFIIYKHKNNTYNLIIKLDHPDIESIDIKLSNISKQETIDKIEESSRDIFDVLHEFYRFTENFEYSSDDYIKRLIMCKTMCQKYSAGNKIAFDIIFNIDKKDFPYFNLKEDGLLNCHFILNEGQAKAIYDKSSWSGLWTGELYIYKEPLDKYSITQYRIKEKIIEIHEIVRHELQHLVQTYIKTNKNLKELGGLPSKKIRQNDADIYGIQKNKTDRLDHNLRDIEFYNDLTDNIQEFKSLLTNIPKSSWKSLAYYWMDKIPFRDFWAVLENEAIKVRPELERYRYNSLVMNQAIHSDGLKYKAEAGNELFSALKNNQPLKYNKAVKEFWKEVSNLF